MKFEDIIGRDGRLIYTNVGDSMLPLIRQGKDLVIIGRKTGRLRKYDVPLYKRPTGEYILHRIIKVRKNDYILCGDNRTCRESGVRDEQIIGVLTAVVRNGKEIPVTDRRYRLYVRIWCGLVFLRLPLILKKKLSYRFRRLLGRTKRS